MEESGGNGTRIVKLPRFVYESIIFGTSEVWKREVYGLVGGRGKNIYYITKVLPIQTADRKFSEVSFYKYKEETLKDNIKIFGGRVLGDFHSHNYYNNDPRVIRLSRKDKKFLKENPNLISILIATEEVERLHRYWRMRNNVLYGHSSTVDSKNKKHKLTTAVVAYYYNISANRILKAQLEPTNGLEKLLIE